jgi:hypothetical protein
VRAERAKGLSIRSDAIRTGLRLLWILEVSQGELVPAFHPETTQYVVDLPLGAANLTVTATAPSDSTIELNGQSIASNEPSIVTLDLGDNLIEVQARSGMAPNTSTRPWRESAIWCERSPLR